MTNMVFRERILINSMLSVAPNIVFVPNMTQNAERKHRTQNTNTAPIRPRTQAFYQTKTRLKVYHPNLPDIGWRRLCFGSKYQNSRVGTAKCIIWVFENSFLLIDAVLDNAYLILNILQCGEVSWNVEAKNFYIWIKINLYFQHYYWFSIT